MLLFLFKDLLALLKTVETEIEMCELNLHDEVEKRKKYKVKLDAIVVRKKGFFLMQCI